MARKIFGKSTLLAAVAGATLLLSTQANAASPCQGSLDDLQNTYDTDRAFNRLITSTFHNIEPLPSEYGQANPWEDKGFPDLMQFLKDWCTFLPTAKGSSDTGLKYIQEFAWLYYLNEYGIRFVKKSPGREIMQDFSKQRGAFMDSKASAAVVADWLADVRIEKDDYNLPDPSAPDGGFDSFNAFFSRTLKNQAASRPQTMPDKDYIIAAPTDCIMNTIPMVITDGNTLIPTKFRQKLNIHDMLGGSAHAERFIGGTALSCVLMPNTYHRYHSPVNGKVVEAKILDDPYYGYNDFPKWVPINGNVGYHGTDFSEFENFKRGYFVVDTGLWGHVAFVPVGLDTISSIQFEDKFQNITTPVPLKRGDELGHFLYGGSLFLMFFEKDRYTSGAIQVRLGNQIGTFDTTDSNPQ